MGGKLIRPGFVPDMIYVLYLFYGVKRISHIECDAEGLYRVVIFQMAR